MTGWLRSVAIGVGCVGALTPFFGADAQVRAVPARPAEPSAAEEWQVGKARTDVCLDTGQIAGATIMDQRTLDILMRGGKRYRMSLASDCPQVGYYGSFYYQVSQAGQLCAGRDLVMGRAGGACMVRSIAPITRKR